MRGKFAIIFNQRILTSKKRIKKFSLYFEISYKIALMVESGIKGIFSLFRNVFSKGQYAFKLLRNLVILFDILE